LGCLRHPTLSLRAKVSPAVKEGRRKRKMPRHHTAGNRSHCRAVRRVTKAPGPREWQHTGRTSRQLAAGRGSRWFSITNKLPKARPSPMFNIRLSPIRNTKPISITYIGPICNNKISPICNIKLIPTSNTKLSAIPNLSLNPTFNPRLSPTSYPRRSTGWLHVVVSQIALLERLGDAMILGGRGGLDRYGSRLSCTKCLHYRADNGRSLFNL
jgi:hypothetical protein